MNSKRKYRIELPERKPDEPDLTLAQKQYIDTLFFNLKIEDFSLDINKLGKWQACTLIEELIETKEILSSNENCLNTTEVKADFSEIYSNYHINKS